MPTPPVPDRTRRPPTRLKAARSRVAGPPALEGLPDDGSAPQLHPLAAAGQLHPESQRVQLQGARVRREERVISDGVRE